MSYYFYLIHAFVPGVVSLQIPIYINANDYSDACNKCSDILNSFKSKFEILFEPSNPVLVNANINKARFDGLMNQLNPPNTIVQINLPFNFHVQCFQKGVLTNPLKTLIGRVIVPGQHGLTYSL